METATLASWPEPRLLPALRESLAGADSALLCVAFANQKGVNLLAPQLEALGGRCRIVVTSTFGETTANALASATAMRQSVRVLNPRAGTFHPKLYLARSGDSAVAVVGSPNLTGGLVSNIEAAVLLRGREDDAPIADAWALGESLWRHPKCIDWTRPGVPLQSEAFDRHLLAALREAIPEGSIVKTLSDNKPNVVTAITPQGLNIETESSRARRFSPQLVPAWMVQLAWDYLQLHRSLTNRYLLDTNGLNVKRYSAVCAVLAQLPEIEVASVRPITLRLREGFGGI